MSELPISISSPMRGREATMCRAIDASSAPYNLPWLPPPNVVGTCVLIFVVLDDDCGTKACVDRAAARYAVAVARPEVRRRVLLREFIPMLLASAVYSRTHARTRTEEWRKRMWAHHCSAVRSLVGAGGLVPTRHWHSSESSARSGRRTDQVLRKTSGIGAAR